MGSVGALIRSVLALGVIALAMPVGASSAPQAADLNEGPVFRSWTQQNGLPTNEVTGLSRSRSGYLFIGTPNGVVRFDGKRFTPVRHTAKTAQHDRGISAFANIPGSDDVLAAPRLGGLLRLSGDEISEQPLPTEFAQTPIEALFFENDITLWVGFKGGIAMRRQANRVEIFDPGAGLDAQEPIQFARDGAGAVWLASGAFLGRYEDGHLTKLPLQNLEKKISIRIVSSRQGGPWVVIGERVCKLTNNQLVELTRLSNATGAYYIQALLEDSKGALWIGTRSRGLHRITSEHKVETVPEAPSDISALLEDSVGNLWVGATSGGILRIKPGVLKVIDRSAGLVENRSLTLCRDDNNTLWFANRDGGIFFGSVDTPFTAFEPTRRWPDFSAYAITPAQSGGVWVTTSHGLLRITPNKIEDHLKLDYLTGRAAPHVAFTAKNGDLWLGLRDGGVCRLRGSDVRRFGVAEGLSAAIVRSLGEDAGGTIWAGCDDGSLYRLESETHFSPADLHSASDTAGAIQAILFDRDRAVWIGTQKAGLLRLDDRGIQRITTENGLVSENITQLIADDRDVLWIGSPGAISYVSFHELERYFDGSAPRIYPVALGPDEGLREATCSSEYQPAVWKTGDGLLWFATQQGVVAIDPTKTSSAPERARAVITSVWFDSQRKKASPTIRVSPDIHNIELLFSAPNLSTPDRVRLRYRLNGFEERWTEDAHDGAARYTHLPPGKYRFEIAAVLAGVPGAESGDSVTLDVQAAWWQTLWFRAAILCAGVGLVVIIVRHVSHRRLHEKLARLERESALDRERTRIAHNIHDDLGAGLTRISLLTQSGHDKANAQLERIYNIVGELIESMDEIVWAVNPTNDDLENVANYLSDYAQSYLSDAGVRCRMQIPKTLPPHVLTAQFRHHLFLTYKEALNNVVKHAHATDTSIEFSIINGLLKIEIADNGIGMRVSAAETSRRNGLKNMRARLHEIGGSLQISPAPGGGTIVTLTAPLSKSMTSP